MSTVIIEIRKQKKILLKKYNAGKNAVSWYIHIFIKNIFCEKMPLINFHQWMITQAIYSTYIVSKSCLRYNADLNMLIEWILL